MCSVNPFPTRTTQPVRSRWDIICFYLDRLSCENRERLTINTQPRRVGLPRCNGIWDEDSFAGYLAILSLIGIRLSLPRASHVIRISESSSLQGWCFTGSNSINARSGKSE